MSRTHIQQSQISGSLERLDTYDPSLAVVPAEGSSSTLAGDLNDLRKQVNRIIGEGAWSDALAGQQDLSDIYAAVHMSGANADFQGTLDVTGVATFDAAITGSAGLQLAGDLDVNSTADFQGAVNLQSTLTVAAAADLNGSLDVAGQVDLAAAGVATSIRGTLSVAEVATFSAAITGSAGLKLAGDADFNGGVAADVIRIDGDSANVGYLYLVGATGEIAEEQDLIWTGDMLKMTGSLDVTNGIHVAGGGLTVAGDRLEVTGSFGLTGAAEIGGALDVDGAVTLGSTLEVVGGMSGSAGLKIAGDADFNGPADFQGAVVMQSTLEVDQLATFDNGITVNTAVADFNAGITANSIAIDSDVAGRLYIVDGSGYISDEANLNFAGGELQVTGSLKVTGSALVEGGLNVDGAADFDSTADFAGAVVMQSSLDVDGAVDLDSTLDVAGNATFRANVDVVGNLTVQGSMTYIETANLKVLDAFIHLATGSTGTQNSGIVLHGGAGASADLMIAQDGGAGEFVFAKLAHGTDHDNVDGSNVVPVDGAELVSAWMSELKVGDLEGSLSGSFAAAAGGAKLEAAADLLLAANGQTPISFIESGEYSAFDLQFPGMSLVGAIIAAGGNFKQDSFKPGLTTAGASIDYSSVGALRSASYASTAAKKLAMDVFLNGVRLAYSDDYSIDASGVLSLTMNTISDDVLTVVIHNAAAS
jgi:hypothetical protein